jgi:hypothetical protein
VNIVEGTIEDDRKIRSTISVCGFEILYKLLRKIMRILSKKRRYIRRDSNLVPPEQMSDLLTISCIVLQRRDDISALCPEVLNLNLGPKTGCLIEDLRAW